MPQAKRPRASDYLPGLAIDYVPLEDLAKLLEVPDGWRVVEAKMTKDRREVSVYMRRPKEQANATT